MVADSRIKNVKMVRIQGNGMVTKWNAFCIYAKSLGKSPRKLLGEIFNAYWNENLKEISYSCQVAMGMEEEE